MRLGVSGTSSPSPSYTLQKSRAYRHDEGIGGDQTQPAHGHDHRVRHEEALVAA